MEAHANYIGGEWVTGDPDIRDVNPSDLDDVVGTYCRATADDVDHAIRAAVDARGTARALTPQARADMLHAAGREILDRAEELGTLLSREEGKTRAEGIGEAKRAANIFLYFAGEALRSGGEVIPSVRPDVDVEVTRESVGVVGIITPWNFPLAIPAWKIAPALAFGNAVVFKPAELVTACAWELTAILDRAGVPPGMFNLVMGSGSVIGNQIVEHEDVAAVSFTGSDGVGRRIAAAVTGRLARVQMEMGGKNPFVVLDDADLPTAVEAAVQGAYFSTGQRCTASSRLIATRGIHDAFVDAVAERVAGLRIGNALQDGVDIGPVVDARQLQTDLDYLDIGRGEGADLVLGGERVERDTSGHYLAPALFVDTKNSMRINQEEIFGPIASVIQVEDLDEAISVANDVRFGLTAGIATTSLRNAKEFRRRSASGMVMVNLPTAGNDYHVPFGGTKGSSYGPREQGAYAREFYTTVKTSYVGY